jgi:hypothetical protein
MIYDQSSFLGQWETVQAKRDTLAIIDEVRETASGKVVVKESVGRRDGGGKAQRGL